MVVHIAYYFILPCYALSQQIRIPQFTTQKTDVLSKGYAFKIVNTRDLLKCMEFCIMFQICQSISVNEKDVQCRLNVATSISAANGMVAEIGAHYIDKKDFPEVFEERCANHNCDSLSGCVNQGSCVAVFNDKYCPPPRLVLYGSSGYVSSVPVGGTLTYTCDPGYPADGIPTITCMDEQEWSYDGSFQCKYSIGCLSGWIHNGNTCYKISSDKRTRNSGKEECNKMSASLLAMETSVEHSFIRNLLKNQADNFMFWVGGNDYSGGIWKYDNGDVINHRDWYSSEPDNIGLQHCLALRESFHFYLANDYCTETRRYICEKPVQHIPYNGS